MKWRQLTHFPMGEFERRCRARGPFGQLIWRPDFEAYSAFVYADAVPEPQYQLFMDYPYQLCSQLTVDTGFPLVASQLARLIADRRMLLAMRGFERVIKSYTSIGPIDELLAVVDTGDCYMKLEQETWFVADKHNATPNVIEAVLDSSFGSFSLGFLACTGDRFERSRPIHELSIEEAKEISRNVVALIAICYDETVPVFLVGPNDGASILGTQSFELEVRR
jgi:hypothetical protein